MKLWLWNRINSICETEEDLRILCDVFDKGEVLAAIVDVHAGVARTVAESGAQRWFLI